MTQLTAARAFADAMAALVDDHDVGDALAQLVGHCAELYPADAVAVLVANRNGHLEPLSATSHRAEELELLQAQHLRGPCVEAVTTNEPVFAVGVDAMTARWGAVGTAIGDAGFESVHAYPMHWRGQALGGLNVFFGGRTEPDDEAGMLGQMFADVATLTLLHSDVSGEQVTSRIHEAVTARAILEQAKGVLAYQQDLDMAAAYDLLVDEARRRGGSLTGIARQIVERGQRGLR